MCTTCNCGQAGLLEAEPAVVSVAASSPHRLELAASLLSRNDALAAALRQRFEAAGVRAINLLSSPGSGKTALLEWLGRHWAEHHAMAVVVGDLATDNDARRLQAAGARAVQIRTGDLCHLDAALVDRAFAQLDCQGIDLLVIENVGNLVCPTAFDLGEERRVAILSVTEGEDKPLKYPALFRSADAVLINKSDLAEAVGFDRSSAIANLQAIAPQAELFELSARSGDGLDALIAWIETGSNDSSCS